MPSLAEVLRQSGLSQEQIDALDAKVMTSLGGVLTTAEKAQQDALAKEKAATEAAAKAEADRKAAEISAQAAQAAKDAADLQKRSVDEFWTNTYNPSVAEWEKQKNDLARIAADAKAEAAYYKAQRESYLAPLGIKPEDAPAYVAPAPDPARNSQGQFVPGKDGSPVFDMNAFVGRATDGLSTIANIQWKYQTLYNGQPLPISPSELIAKADAMKLPPMEWASRTFKFAEKEEEQRLAAAKAHDDAIRAERDTVKDAEWKAKVDAREAEFALTEKTRAEQRGNNPDVRLATSSKIPELQRQVAAKEIPDPLMMNESQRRAQTTKMIRDTITEKDSAAA
jgi:hypothetical protein